MGMLLVIYTISVVTNAIVTFPKEPQGIDLGWLAILFWFRFEWLEYLSTIGSSILFILIRSCAHHKI